MSHCIVDRFGHWARAVHIFGRSVSRVLTKPIDEAGWPAAHDGGKGTSVVMLLAQRLRFIPVNSIFGPTRQIVRPIGSFNGLNVFIHLGRRYVRRMARDALKTMRSVKHTKTSEDDCEGILPSCERDVSRFDLPRGQHTGPDQSGDLDCQP